MRTIEGFVCIGKTELASFIFGRNINLPDSIQTYENIFTNGLVPYKNLEEAEKGISEIRRLRDIKDSEIKRISMRLSETLEEVEELKDEKNLVVVATYEDSEHRIYGPSNESCRGSYPGALVTINGMRTFDSYDETIWLARELSRQSDSSPATLATFELEDIE